MFVFLIHKFLYDKGATNPEYVVTADEVDKLIVVLFTGRIRFSGTIVLVACFHIFNESRVADNYHRPDLKKAAFARFSAVNRSLKVSTQV
ncbi:hypothetical protein Hanom_Chr15g01350371 [Helianthus anomalus]